MNSPADGIMNEFASFEYSFVIVLITNDIQFPFAIKHCQSSNKVIFWKVYQQQFLSSISLCSQFLTQFLSQYLVRVFKWPTRWFTKLVCSIPRKLIHFHFIIAEYDPVCGHIRKIVHCQPLNEVCSAKGSRYIVIQAHPLRFPRISRISFMKGRSSAAAFIIWWNRGMCPLTLCYSFNRL